MSSTGAGYWKADLAGAMVYATWQFMKRDAVVTELVWTNIDLVEGHLLHLTNKDQSRTYASIFMHENKLYIAEATVPAGEPEPGLFQQALGFIDENGRSIRYQTLYHNGFPTPPLALSKDSLRTSLVLTVIGADRPGIVEQLSDSVLAAGANWEESRMARLAGKFAGVLRVSVDAARADRLADDCARSRQATSPSS